MRFRRPVSVSTLVALAIAGVTAAAIVLSLPGSGSTGTVNPIGAVSDEVAGGTGDLLVQDATVHLTREARGTIQQAVPPSSDLTLRGAIGLQSDKPVAGATAAPRPTVRGECPAMTDSLRRLYLGFLEREPTPDELAREIDLYRTGRANLEDLAGALADSGRFRSAYGLLGHQQYVERVYANTVERSPTAAELDHWTSNLDLGYPRGSVMLAFTESAEFVRLTGTTRPLSGYLTWYPRGTHWYCGVGPRNDLPIEALTGDTLFADYLFINPGQQATVTGLTTVFDGGTRVTMSAAEVPAGFSDYRWDGVFTGADHYGNAIDVIAAQDTGWVVVFYPRSIGRQRLGWQVPS